jgi:hypothetical protein
LKSPTVFEPCENKKPIEIRRPSASSPYFDYIQILDYLSFQQKLNLHRSLNIRVPETVVFQNGQVDCIFSVTKEMQVQKIITLGFQDVRKKILKLKPYLQDILKWVDGYFLFIYLS